MGIVRVPRSGLRAPRPAGWSGLTASVCVLTSIAVPAGAQPQLGIDAPSGVVSVWGPVTALIHATLIDGSGAPVRSNQTVVIRGGAIESVGSSDSVRIPRDAQVLDVAGHTIIPGVVGLHEHTYFAGGAHATQMSVAAPMLYLAHGVTSAMTAGSLFPYEELTLQRRVDAGRLPGPRFFIAGPYLDGLSPGNAFARTTDNVDEVRRVVAYWAAEGATWVKVLGNIKHDVLAAAIDEAHRRGIRVTGHLCSVTYRDAAMLGIDALQHGLIASSDHVPGKLPDRCPPNIFAANADLDVESGAVRQTIRMLATRGTPVVSTLAVYESLLGDSIPLPERAGRFLTARARVEADSLRRALLNRPILPRGLLTRMMAWEREFLRQGGILAAGADPWATGLLPGVGNLRNYELLVEAGLKSEEAVRVLTFNGAKTLGVEGRLGLVREGYVADIVVIAGQPSQIAADIYRTVTVFKDGIGYDAERLRHAALASVGAR